jgi:hypothetical protein
MGTPAPPPAARWPARRVVAVVIGVILGLISLVVLAAGASLLWFHQTQRQGGYLTSSASTFHASGYALASKDIELMAGGPQSLIGTVRVRVTSADPQKPVFVGIARAAAADTYLARVQHDTVTGRSGDGFQYEQHAGAAPATPPTRARIWTAQTTGTGVQTLEWPLREGRWTLVVMNADGSANLTVRADAGATVPALTWTAVALLIIGAVLLAIAVILVAVPIWHASREPPAETSAGGTSTP